jgi:radical SAM superfamily enzyme YgiQ (UPF0313 family)
VDILDVAVGNNKDQLAYTFFKPTRLNNGMLRIGLPSERIVEEMTDYDVLGISSVFTPQTSRALELIHLARSAFPDKPIIVGGINARNLRRRFFEAGADFIFLSEAEISIVEFAEWLEGRRPIDSVSGIAYCDDAGKEVIQPTRKLITNLDELPIPAWDLLPLEKYWDISRPHGGFFKETEKIRYAAIQTSRGCSFTCSYCHISNERDSEVSNDIARWRPHSLRRVEDELWRLKDLGAKYIFVEDDSFLAKKARAFELMRIIKDASLTIADVNGVNIVHCLKNNNGQLEPDYALIEALGDAGFRWIYLPFESGSQRLLDRYSSSKWHINKTNTAKLIEAFRQANITVAGNYMLGFPDETLEEMYSTILSAKRHMEEGLDHALFFTVIPYPGSALYDEVIARGQLDPGFNTDNMKLTRTVLKNTPVTPETLGAIRQLAWLTVNRKEFVDYKMQQRLMRP